MNIVPICWPRRFTFLDDDHCDRKLHVSRANPYFRSIEAFGQEQDNLCPETEVLRCFMGAYECQQFLIFSFRERYGRRFGTRHRRLLCVQNEALKGQDHFIRARPVAKGRFFSAGLY
jgi:hypothetical protein